MRIKHLFIILMLFIACASARVFAGYELNQVMGPSGRVINVSGCVSASGGVVRQGSYKFFGVCGQNTVMIVSSINSEVKPGFIQVIKAHVLSFLQSVPYLGAIRAQFSQNDTHVIQNNRPTNHNTPFFIWNVPASVSPVTEYQYSVKNRSGIEVFAGILGQNNLDITVDKAKSEEYTLTLKALNQAGNWGNESAFVYRYDNSGPEPVGYITLQAWGDQYFHPLTIKLEFPFTEYLDGNRVNTNTMTLGQQKWDNTWEDVGGTITYNDNNQALLFTPDRQLKAMGGYKINFKDVYDLAGNSFTGEISFKTFLGAAMQADITSDDGNVNLSIPHWGLKKDALVMVAKLDHENETVSKANRKAELKLNTLFCDDNVYKVEVLDLKFNPIDSFNKKAELSFMVPDADDDGIWDNTNIRLKDVVLAQLDMEKKDWRVVEEEDSVIVNRAPGRPLLRSVSMPVQEAVYYRLISYLAPGTSAGNVIIYPNPFMPASGHTEITFLRLPADAEIDIYNLAGEIIRRFPASDQGQVLWDGTNDYGLKAASGVYIALIKSNGSKKAYKIAIER